MSSVELQNSRGVAAHHVRKHIFAKGQLLIGIHGFVEGQKWIRRAEEDPFAQKAISCFYVATRARHLHVHVRRKVNIFPAKRDANSRNYPGPPGMHHDNCEIGESRSYAV